MLSVADTGIGIPAADRQRIFERFYRTEAATRRVIPGSGLGLTISRAIVDAHRGTISVRSDGKQGSTFTVRLPLALGSSAWRRGHGATSGVRAIRGNPYTGHSPGPGGPCSLAGTGWHSQVVRLGQRPAPGRQVGPDLGDVGVAHLLVGDSERNSPTRLSTPERATATRGGSAPVAIEVAIALPVSWKPLVKSKDSAVTTTRASSRSLLTATASRDGICVSRGQAPDGALCQHIAIPCLLCCQLRTRRVAAECPAVNGFRVAQSSSADTMPPGRVPAWAASAPSDDQRPERPAQSV